MCSDIMGLFIDMEVNNHINSWDRDRWVRCQRVTLRDGALACTLAPEQTYSLTQAYKCDLHIRFANALTDHDLIAFMRAWGPLYIPNFQATPTGLVSLPLSYCRAFQRWLKALVDLLAAFKWAEDERAALQEFAEAEYEDARNSALHSDEPPVMPFLRHKFGISGDILDWVRNADLRAVRTATDFLVSLAQVGPQGAHLVCCRSRGRRYVEADWTISTLEDALRWMVWYDEFTKHPIVCCQECRKVFRAESAHLRKYCTHECAHRATARVWQRNKRARQRAGRK